MTIDGRQKTMLGLLSVLAVGMGGYWYVAAGGSASSEATASHVARPVRKREPPPVAVKTKKVRHPKESVTTAKPRERERADGNAKNAKRTRGRSQEKVKKKKEEPAS